MISVSVLCLFSMVFNSIPFRTAGISDNMKVPSVQSQQKRSLSSWAIKMGKQAVKDLLNGAVWIGRKNGVDFFEKYTTDTKAMKQFQDLFPEGIHRSEAGLSRTGLVGNRIITIRKRGDGFPYTFIGISKPNTDIVETVIRFKDIGTAGKSPKY